MNQQTKKKLCWNCEGSVARTLETCPFCGVYLNPVQEDGPTFSSSAFGQKESLLDSPPPPPYSPQEKAEEAATAENNEDTKASISVYALLLILSGSVYGLFGLVVLLFSQNGVFSLSWSQGWSYVFLAIALPLLTLGFLQLRRLKD